MEEVKVWDGGVTVLFKDTTPQEMGHILAWAKLEEDVDTITDLDKYLKNVAINFHFLGEIVHTKPGEGPPLDVHLEISRMYSDSITRAISFYPYGNYISEKTSEDQFVVTLKFCNLAGCSQWAPPIVVKPPKIVPRSAAQNIKDVVRFSERMGQMTLDDLRDVFDQASPELLEDIFQGIDYGDDGRMEIDMKTGQLISVPHPIRKPQR